MSPDPGERSAEGNHQGDGSRGTAVRTAGAAGTSGETRGQDGSGSPVIRGDLTPLLAPRTVAVVGASLSPRKAGNAMVRTLAALGPDRLWPVNPRGGRIGDIPVHASLDDLPGVPDLAVLVVPPQATPAALDACGKLGVPSAIVCAGGFAEADPNGARLQDEVAAAVRQHGMRLLGPNTSGLVNPVDGVHATFLPAAAGLRPGPVAVVAASGGINLALSFMLAEAGTGIRLGVGLGNALDVGTVDVLRHLARDHATRAVALHIESVTDGRALFDAVAALTPSVPVAALVVGRADVGDFARSHTGALSGAYDVTRAALAQAGAVVVDRPTDLVDTVRALAARRARPRRDPGLAVVTGQAGPGLVLADTLQSAGARLPELAAATRAVVAEELPPITFQRNPVDTGRPGPGMPRLVGAVAADPEIDAMVVYALEEPDVLPPVEAVGPAVEQGVPVLFASGGPTAALDRRAEELAALDVPLYRSPDAAATAALGLLADARAAHRRATPSQPQPDVTHRDSGGITTADLDEVQAKQLLAQVGLRVPEHRVCADRAAAHAALAELGGPVVVKVLDAAVLHKTEAGGVHVGVATAAQLDAALDAIDAIPVGTTPRDRATRRYLVEAQAEPGVELIVGGIADPVFGPVVLLAPGGVAVELAGRAARRLVPLTPGDAREMVSELPAALLDGFRGLAPVDRDELAAVLLAVGGLLAASPDVAELDVNPLRATPRGLVALDALVVRAAAEPTGRAI